MNQASSGADRRRIIGGTAVYFLIYALLIAVGALLLALLAGCTGTHGSCSTTPQSQSQALVEIVVGLILGAIFVLGAWGLFRRKAWARLFALIPLGISLLPVLLALYTVLTVSEMVLGSTLNLIIVVASLIWILIGGFVMSRFLTDAGIKQALSQ